MALASGDRRVTKIPARFLHVRKALAQGVYDGFHFSGHGLAGEGDPNRSAVRLEAGEEMSAEELCGVVANLGKAKPLVFMNACQIGRTGMSLTDVGGWASQFLRAGAGAFVGAYWSVYDSPARGFASAFYTRLLAGNSVGAAARAARAEVRVDDDPTWLAYTVYADPAAVIGRGKEGPKDAA
jgi:CHAT domain-containing protein